MSDPILETDADFENFYKKTRQYYAPESYRQFQDLIRVEQDGTYWNFRIYLVTGTILNVTKLNREDIVSLCKYVGNHDAP